MERPCHLLNISIIVAWWFITIFYFYGGVWSNWVNDGFHIQIMVPLSFILYVVRVKCGWGSFLSLIMVMWDLLVGMTVTAILYITVKLGYELMFPHMSAGDRDIYIKIACMFGLAGVIGLWRGIIIVLQAAGLLFVAETIRGKRF